jgi:hypothetical protein
LNIDMSRADVLGGVINITPAAGWVQREPHPGMPRPPLPTVRYDPADGRNASVLITLLPGAMTKVNDLASLKTLFALLSRPYLQSPDTSVVPTELTLPGGMAVYKTFVDPDLVGKPVKKYDYKSATPVAVLITGTGVLHMTIYTDSVDASDFAEAMKIVQSVAPLSSGSDIAPANNLAGGPRLSKKQDRQTLSVAALGAALSLPARFQTGLKMNPHPGYFMYVDENRVNLSGWLEQSVRFNGMRSFWAAEKATMTEKAGFVVEGESFKIVNGWTAVLYTVRIEGLEPQKNIRACRVVGDTWADVHLSILEPGSTWKQLEDVVRELTLAAK